MNTLRNLGRLAKTMVIAYIVSGIAYWATAEIYIRLIGKEVTFSPLISVLLTVPFWPMDVYADLKWIGIMPYDIAAVLAVLISVPLLLRKYGMWYTSRPDTMRKKKAEQVFFFRIICE